MSKHVETKYCQANCPCSDVCPLDEMLTVIGGKWKLRIICSLNADGVSRYSELKKKILGITDTMLAASLRELESDGLITRTQFPEIPPRVEYGLTEHAKSLIPVLDQLIAWIRS